VKPLRLLSLALLALLLSACTIYVGPGSVQGRVTIGITLNDIIARFEPTKGSGGVYAVGEPIVFTLFARESGYITLTAIDPDGSVYAFARNMFVEGGRSNVLPGPSERFVFLADRPTGFHRIRASFTSGRTDTGRVTYVGSRGEEAWTNSITVELNDFPVRDVAETSLIIR
jgi:hypothetical protein